MSGVSNPLRHRIGKGEPIGLIWMALGSSSVVELAVQAKPDAIVIDAQHGLWDRKSLEHAWHRVKRRAGSGARCREFRDAISQALDTGAEGVIVR